VCSRLVPSEEWILLRDMHAGYITWEEYQSNLAKAAPFLAGTCCRKYVYARKSGLSPGLSV